jgi:hypothetical protein
MKISMQDFIKIFKSDKVSENMVKIINQEALANKHHQENTSTILKPPDIKSNSGDAGTQNPLKVSLSLRTNDQRAMIELNSEAPDQISLHR